MVFCPCESDINNINFTHHGADWRPIHTPVGLRRGWVYWSVIMIKLASNQLPHIDNNFYVLNSSQVKALSIDGKAPRDGYAKKCDSSKLAGLQCGKIKAEELPRGESLWTFKPFDNALLSDKSEAWIQQTPLSWFNGKPVESGFVMALHVCKY